MPMSNENKRDTKTSTQALRFPFNEEVARELESKIDPCGFATIKRYFLSPESEIDQIVIVQEGYKLEEVAAFFVAPESNTVTLEAMLRAGVFKYGYPSLALAPPEWHTYIIAFDKIADDLMVYALYCPPAYIIKTTDEFWR